jgi:hypothetical protein
MGKKNQYCEMHYTTKSNLNVQFNSHQNPNDILHSDRKINSKVHLETRKILNNQSNPVQKSNAGGFITSNFKLYYRTISNKNSMVLAPKQT